MSWFMGGACLFFGLVACGLQPPITPQSKTHCLPLSHTPQQPNSILSLAFPATAKKEGVGGAVEEREKRREIDSMKKEVAAIKEEFHFFPFFIDLPSFFISSTHSQTNPRSAHSLFIPSNSIHHSI